MKANCYIFSNTVIRRKNNTVFIDKIQSDSSSVFDKFSEYEILSGLKNKQFDLESSKAYPIENINALFAYGSANYNSKLLGFIAKYRIPFHIFSKDASYIGTFFPGKTCSDLTDRQAAVFSQYDSKLLLAKKILLAFLNNAFENLRFYHSKGINLNDHIDLFYGLFYSVNNADLNKIYEIFSNSKYIYCDANEIIFNYFSNNYKKIEILKCLKSLADVMLYSDCLTEIYRCGLLPNLSILNYKKEYPLALDLALIFKPIIADRLIFYLLEQKLIYVNDFFYFNNFCTLKDNAHKTFIEQYERRLCVSAFDEKLNAHNTFRNLIANEAKKIADYINFNKDYEPFIYKSN
jgi:CRISPR-associated protein Cas1